MHAEHTAVCVPGVVYAQRDRESIMQKHHRSIFLVIVQAWIVPCHGFAYTPHRTVGSLGLASSPTAHDAPFAAPLPCPPTATDRGTLSSLSMSAQGGEGFDAYGDEDQDHGSLFGAKSGGDGVPVTPEPYREEHTSGGTRFRELLARAKGEVKPSAPVTPRREAPPHGGANYDNDQEWEESIIGSPDLPQPPLRNEMPGLHLSPELDQAGPEGRDGGGGGGVGGESRFQRMMNQAQANEQRQVAGVAPRTSPRSQEGKPAPPPITQAEKDRALRAAVDRQQKLMSKARGIDLDDPSLDGPALAKKKALSRLEAESSAGGYIPSSSAADDYMAQLKADSRRKIQKQVAGLSGHDNPAGVPGASGASSEEFDDDVAADVVPQKRTSSTFSVTNKADAYMASLKGIKIDLPESPRPAQAPAPRLTPPQLPPTPKSPLGPSMSYAEKLKLAKEGKLAPQAAATPAVPVAPATPAASRVSETPPPSTLSYSEKLKQAQEAKGAAVAAPAQPAPVPAARPPVEEGQVSRSAAPVRLLEQEVPESALLGEDAARAKMTRVVDMLAEQEASGAVGKGRAGELRDALVELRAILRAETENAAPQLGKPATDALKGDAARAKMKQVVGMLAEQESAGVVGEGQAGELRDALVGIREMLRAETDAAAPQHEEPATTALGEDAAQAKITRVMDLLTEHKKSGLIGEERVAELRRALLDAREFLRAETYGQLAPAVVQTPAVPAVPAAPAAPAAQPQQLASASAKDLDILRRCNALLAAHIYAPLTGQDAAALFECMASSLAIVRAQTGGVTVTAGDPAGQEAPRVDAVVEPVPAHAGGIPSVGSALADMGMGDKPEKFEPESDSGDSKGWLGGSLGDYEKGVASKALGYLLKHRGGKGYGRGRVKGKEAELMVSTLAEVAEILEEEMIED